MCTRVFNNRNPNFLATSRNMDWAETLPTSLFYFKAGLEKVGLTKEEFIAWIDRLKKEGVHSLPSYQPVQWTSKFSSIVAMVGSEDEGWASSDGINSAGLVANVLYDTGFSPGYHPSHEQLSVLRWAQFVLDNYGHVSKLKSFFNDTPPQLIAAQVPSSPDKSATLHLSVSDADGNSMIVEVVDGIYNLYDSPEYTIMTNEPSYKEQLEMLKALVEKADGDANELAEIVSGGPFSPNRFERAAFYYHFLNAPHNTDESCAQTKGVTASASVPVGFKLEGSGPNNASTLWTTIANQKRGNFKYYFNNSRVVNTVWFDMQKDLPEHDVACLEMVVLENNIFKNLNYDGCINEEMKATSDPFAEA